MNGQSFEEFEKFVKDYQEEERESFEAFENFVLDRLKKRETKPAKVSPFDVIAETGKETWKRDLAPEWKGIKEGATGAAETISALGTGMAGWVLSRPAIVGKYLDDLQHGQSPSLKGARDFADKIAGKAAYQPKGEIGQKLSEIVAWPFMQYEKAVDTASKFYFPKNKELQAATKTGADALLLALPVLKGALKGRVIQAIKNKRIPKEVIKEVLQEADVPKKLKVEIENIPKEIIEEAPKQPGIELREIRKRHGLVEKPGAELPKTKAEQIKAFEEAGKVEKLPSKEGPIGRAEQPLTQDFMYKRSMKGQEAKPPWSGGLPEEMKRPVYYESPKKNARGQPIHKVRIDTVQTPQQLDSLLKMIESDHGAKFDKVLGDPVTMKGLELELKQERLTIEYLKGKQAHTAKETLAMGQAVKAFNLDYEKAHVTWSETPTLENRARVELAYKNKMKAGYHYYKLGTEWGRVGKARQRVVTEGVAWNKFEKRLLKMYESGKLTEEVWRKMATIEDPMQQLKFAIESVKTPFPDKIYEYWINGLLSGLPTQVVNVVSNIFLLAEKPFATLGAAVLEAPKKLVGKTPEVYFGEAWHEFAGMAKGIQKAARTGANSWKTEMPRFGLEDVTKLDIRPWMTKAIKGKKGKIIRIPSRALIAADEFFKSLIWDADVSSVAFRETAKSLKNVKNKLSPKEYKQRFALEAQKFLSNPDPEVWWKKKAFKETKTRTFQEDFGKFGKSVQGIRNTQLGRYIIPFLRVSINIPKMGFRRTPLYIPRIIHKLVTGKYAPGEFPREVMQTAIGSIFSTAFFLEALEGNITGGGPVDKNQRDLLYRQGWQPYSIKIGNKYFSYQRIEPIGTIFGLAADMGEIWDQVSSGNRERLAERFVAVVTQNIENKTFMRGVSDALNAITDPERNLERWGRRFAGSWIPTGSAYTAKAIDPTVKDVRSFIDELKSRIPGLSQQVPTRRDVYGKPIRREGGPIKQMVSPVWESSVKKDFVDKELSRLGMAIGRPGRKIQIGRVRGKRKYIELSPQAYERLVTRGGGLLHHVLSGLLLSYEYRTLNDEDKIKKIESTVRNVRRSINEPIRALHKPQGVR